MSGKISPVMELQSNDNDLHNIMESIEVSSRNNESKNFEPTENNPLLTNFKMGFYIKLGKLIKD